MRRILGVQTTAHFMKEDDVRRVREIIRGPWVKVMPRNEGFRVWGLGFMGKRRMPKGAAYMFHSWLLFLLLWVQGFL